MAIKVEIAGKDKEGFEYPCLKKAREDFIVLFTSQKTGMVIQTDRFWNIGEFRSNWDEHSFTPFTGKITLENE